MKSLKENRVALAEKVLTLNELRALSRWYGTLAEKLRHSVIKNLHLGASAPRGGGGYDDRLQGTGTKLTVREAVRTIRNSVTPDAGVFDEIMDEHGELQ